LLLIVGLTGLAAHRPWLFASLAPTAYEFAEKPELPGSRIYNAIVGHLVGVGAGFFSTWALAAWAVPPVMSSRFLTPQRVWASVLAIALTSFVAVLLKAFHPAAAATALLVSLGAFSTKGDAITLIAGILIIGFCGYFVRHIRLGLHKRAV
jgi:hypothetical protein